MVYNTAMGLDTRRIRALCFDVDGTLSDTDDLYVQRISHRLPRLLAKDPDRVARRLVMWAESPGNALIGLPDIVGLDDELLRLWEWLNRHRPRPMKHFLLIPGVGEMLKHLNKKYPMAVVSARDDRSTRAFLDRFELTGYFQEIVTAVTAEHTKPYPDPIYYAAEKMGVAPERCLMIGDTTVDIRAGKAAGSQTVGVLCGFGEEPELRRHGADLILDATPGLVDVLLNKKKKKTRKSK
jgi:phosphoglycolate phosphatase-like HAD superfamily hydrolase